MLNVPNPAVILPSPPTANTKHRHTPDSHKLRVTYFSPLPRRLILRSVEMPSWTHLIRFVAEETGQIHLGQIDAKEFPDVGLASFEGKKITAKEITGSIFDGVVTDKVLTVKQVH